MSEVNDNSKQQQPTNTQQQPQQTVDALDPLDLNEPEKIGDFIVGKTMGRGTFGKVKLGTHTSTNEKVKLEVLIDYGQVAIKILDKQKIKDQSDLERINREIKILKKLRHPHVVQLFQIIENERYLYLIMEYCSGDQIMKHIKKNGRLKEQEACRFYQQMISAVEYIHRLGIVHRDIKPENILLDHNNNVKVVDFGLGNLYAHGNMLKTACGSPCYAAPEMTKGLPYHGIMTDIWSSGVVLFVMVTGALPFQDRNTNKLYQKIQTADYRLPDFLSDTCRDFIKRILVPDWNLRYRIEDIRAHPFYNLASPIEKDGIIIDKNFQVQFDEKILTKMENDYKVNVENAKQELKANRFTSNTTIYYLLLKRHERVGLLRQQFQLDIQSKTKKVVNVQMVLNQQQQQQAKLENNQDDASASPPQKAIQQQPSHSSNQQQMNLQETAAVVKQRQDHSTDVRGGGTNIQMQMRATNYMSTINPEVIVVQQPQQHLQGQFFNQTTIVDPFSKINNPKARKLIENLEKQKNATNGTAGRHDSTGGSGEYGEFISYHHQQVQNARNLPGGNNLNIMMFQQSTGGQENMDNLNDSIMKQDSIMKAMKGGGQVVNQQQQQLLNNSSQLVTTGIQNARQQLPSPSYQNYLFSEKLTPSHYRSPLPSGNQMQYNAPSMDQYVKIPPTAGTKQQAKLNTSNIKQQQNQVIANIISQTASSTAQKKYRSASRSNNDQQQQINPSPKVVKKPSIQTGVVTPSYYGRVKTQNQGLQNANTTQMINNPQQLLNQSFQENPSMIIGKGQRLNNGNESIDMDMYVASPNLNFGKTTIGFGNTKNNNRVGTQLGGRVIANQNVKNGDYNMQPNTVRTSNSNYNTGAPTPPNQNNLNFSLNQNNTIIIRNPQSNTTPLHHVRHNSYNGNGNNNNSPIVQQRQKAIVNINQMLNTGGGANGGIGFKKFLNQTQDNQQRASITPEEVALYVNATNAQQIINGKRSIQSKKTSQQKNNSLNQTFY